MGYCKWIGGFLGALNGGIIGAIAGYAIGSFVDSLVSPEENGSGGFDGHVFGNQNNDSYSSGNYSHDTYDAYDNNGYGTYDDGRQQEGERNGFLFSLMVLASHIIQADGKIMHSEMEHVRRFLRMNFGNTQAEEGNEILLRLFDYRKIQGETAWQQQMVEVCQQLRTHMPEEYLLQLLSFLADITKADGRIDALEVEALKQIARLVGLGEAVVTQMLYTGGTSLEDAYKVLGITPDATDDEVRKAYKTLALKYHPDRVATLGEDVKQAAQRKFQEINAAKEQVFKSRNM